MKLFLKEILNYLQNPFSYLDEVFGNKKQDNSTLIFVSLLAFEFLFLTISFSQRGDLIGAVFSTTKIVFAYTVFYLSFLILLCWIGNYLGSFVTLSKFRTAYFYSFSIALIITIINAPFEILSSFLHISAFYDISHSISLLRLLVVIYMVLSISKLQELNILKAILSLVLSCILASVIFWSVSSLIGFIF